jgi:hypothetical protein
MPRRKAQEVVEPEGGWRVVGKDDPEAFPLCVVFDLEYALSTAWVWVLIDSYTLWDLWIDVCSFFIAYLMNRHI